MRDIGTEAYILIGGRSRRFERDKANVDFGNGSLLERTAKTIREAISPTQITLVAANEKQFAFGGFPFVYDLHEGFGPLGGLHAALAYARTEWIFVVACDLPLISSELIAMLAGKVSDDIDACVPIQNDGHAQPLCAFYKVKPSLSVIDEFFAAGRPSTSVRSILDKLITRFVPFDEIGQIAGAADLFLNMNTVDELKRAEQIFLGTAPKPDG